MRLLHLFGALAASISTAEASWAKNINYRSPSEHHPGLGVAVHKVVKRNNPATVYGASNLNFTHGVASGDPYPNSVILWTRVAPMYASDASNASVSGYVPLYNHDNNVNVSTGPICVQYKVAEDRNLTDVVTSGQAFTSSDIDYTVKVRAGSLVATSACWDSLSWNCPCCNLQVMSMANIFIGRSWRPQTVHNLLLPIQCLWLLKG